VHDFRRTMRTQLSALGVPSEVAERCLNHELGDVYNHHDYFEERRNALALWADLLRTLSRGERYNVVPLRVA
jgi:hypothetical protein